MNISQKINIETFFRSERNIPLIDVRSPAEFEHGHIPEAINLPLFDNDERAIIGTMYKQNGREEAIMKGVEVAGPKMTRFIQDVKKKASNNKIYIHCWRGGMRSETMAWVLNLAGIKCYILEGGYKAYRKYLKKELKKEAYFVIIGGMTGSGKTEILKRLELLGEQIIDLEALAHHKGSAFGGIGQKLQPTTEQFENNLLKVWKKQDLNRSIWLEDESKLIGKVQIPDEIFFRMRQNPVIEIKMDKTIRINRLIMEYAKLNPLTLETAVLKISKKLGGLNTKICIEAINKKDFRTAVSLVLNYYDKAYYKGLKSRNINSLYLVKFETDDALLNANTVLTAASKNGLLA